MSEGSIQEQADAGEVANSVAPTQSASLEVATQDITHGVYNLPRVSGSPDEFLPGSPGRCRITCHHRLYTAPHCQGSCRHDVKLCTHTAGIGLSVQQVQAEAGRLWQTLLWWQPIGH